MTATPALVNLTKHHGLGNDFLVLIDLEGRYPIDAERARALCARRFGVGADGLIRVTAGGADFDVAMELRNADGTRAEMSGNGIRCLGQAVLAAGVVAGPDVRVSTDAGARTLRLRSPGPRGCALIGVSMGRPRLVGGTGACNVSNGRQAVDMGNPHLVILGPDPSTLAVERLGPELEASTPGGVNVEFVALGPRRDEVTMRVWERGVGETLACGTGACAVAAAVHGWDLVGPRVLVHQPGGTAEVDLSGPEAVLTGPSQYVATVQVPWE